MPEIKCPKCGETFKVDEAQYESIANQIRDNEFNKRIKIRETEIIENLKIKTEREKDNLINEYNAKVTDLKNIIANANKDKELAVREASEKYKEEIAKLNNKITEVSANQKVAVLEAIDKAKAEKDKVIKDQEKQIEYYKNFKQSLSTKAVGEDLEVYCHNEFDKIRSAAFPKAYFDKDNDVVEGAKGDFIFKDFTDSGEEYISIMFEMKNENDETATKHKNEDFFAKLDKDRKNKHCEYAVLVSTLEKDSDVYTGINDVSYKYEKMYVIRPQFFIPIITILRNAALKNVGAVKELATLKTQNIDVTNFEEQWNIWKESFKKNITQSGKHFNDAIKDIDDTIKKLEKVRDELEGTIKQLGYANSKVEDLTMKKLAKNSPSLKGKL